jgi:hypothetical protein
MKKTVLFLVVYMQPDMVSPCKLQQPPILRFDVKLMPNPTNQVHNVIEFGCYL